MQLYLDQIETVTSAHIVSVKVLQCVYHSETCTKIINEAQHVSRLLLIYYFVLIVIATAFGVVTTKTGCQGTT